MVTMAAGEQGLLAWQGCPPAFLPACPAAQLCSELPSRASLKPPLADIYLQSCRQPPSLRSGEQPAGAPLLSGQAFAVPGE